jgi:hypothetical protein
VMPGGDTKESEFPTDPYADQKASVRDTAKWMAVAYAAVAGVLIAGAPFSGIGSLERWRLGLTIVTGAIALLTFLLALRDILDFLIGEFCFADKLNDGAKAFIDQHANDILPARFVRYQDFLSERNAQRDRVKICASALTDALNANQDDQIIKVLRDQLQEALSQSAEFEQALPPILAVAHLFVLKQQLKAMRFRLAWLTIVGTVAIFAAIWAAKPPKPDNNASRADLAILSSFNHGR